MAFSWSGALAYSTNVVVNDNSVVNNTTANLYVNYGTPVLDASANYWGSSSAATIAGTFTGPGGFSAATNVDFTPFLNNSTDTAPATPGFQPDFSSLTVLPSTVSAQVGSTGRIQEGLNLATATGTVDVTAGTYSEQVSGGSGQTLTALGIVSMGDGSAAGFDVAANLNVNNQSVTLSDSDGATLTGTVNLGSTGGTLIEANGVIIGNGGTLAGSGTVSGPLTIANGGFLSPGTAGPGAIDTAMVTLNSTSAFNVDINGTTAGTGYDQVAASGQVALGGATLNVALGSFTPSNGSSYTIISNSSGSGSGIFAGHIGGSTFTVGSTTFMITYTGGSGHDVILTVANASPPSTPVLAPGSDSGVQGDDITNVTTPTLTGTADAGTTVTIIDTFNSNTTPLGTATLASLHQLGRSPCPPRRKRWPRWVHSIVAHSDDGHGHVFDSVTPLSLTILTTPPAAPSTPAITAQTRLPADQHADVHAAPPRPAPRCRSTTTARPCWGRPT